MSKDNGFKRILLLTLIGFCYVSAEETAHGTTPFISKTITPSIYISTSNHPTSSASHPGLATSSTSLPPMTTKTTPEISKTSTPTSPKTSDTTLPPQSTPSNRTPNISKTTPQTTRNSVSPMSTHSQPPNTSSQTTSPKTRTTHLTSEFTSPRTTQTTPIQTLSTQLTTQPLSASTGPASVSFSPHGSTFSTETPTPKTTSHVTSARTPSFKTSLVTPVSTHASKTTQTQTTRTTIPSTSTLHPHLAKFGIRDKTGKYCILLQAEFVFSIPYTKDDNTTSTITIMLPQSATVNGTCNKSGGLQDITLTFFQTWSLTITMGKSTPICSDLSNDDTGSKSYSWNSVTFVYSTDGHFDKPMSKGKSMDVHTKPSPGQFQAETSGFYRCMSKQTLRIEAVTLKTSNFQYLAFGEGTRDSFPNTGLTECLADKNAHTSTTHTAAIVGSITGATVAIIVLVIGVIYCRRKSGDEQIYNRL